MKAMKQSIEKKISGVGAVAAAVAFIAAVSGHIAVTAIAAVIGIAAVFHTDRTCRSANRGHCFKVDCNKIVVRIIIHWTLSWRLKAIFFNQHSVSEIKSPSFIN